MDRAYFERTFHYDETSGVPMYEQLLSYFRHLIQTGELKPGDQLIPETEICALARVSRTTVRQAMDELVKDGLIIRRRGRGSFVADTKLTRPLSHLYNFTEDMKALGVTPRSIVLSAGVEFVNADVRAHLSLPLTQDKVFHLTRLRCAAEEPMLIEDTYLPYYLCPGIEKTDFSSHSLYQTLRSQYGLHLYHATETIEAVIISRAQAKLLDCKAGSAGYRITRLSHLDTGYAFEYTSSVTRADRCQFQLELYSEEDQSGHPVHFQRNARL